MLEQKAGAHRESLKAYNIRLTDQMMTVATSCMAITYALYTLSPDTVAKFKTTNLIFTLPFVLYGIFRYLYLLYYEGKGGNPEEIFITDAPMIVNIFLYAAAVFYILYNT
jgi:hypothetical protein